MNDLDVVRLLPLLLVFGGALIAAGVFRLTAINTFIDHRKTALRNQLRDCITTSPYLLVAIQRLGKVPELGQREEELFSAIHPAYGIIVREIHQLRDRAFRWGVRLRIALGAWLLVCSVLAVVSAPPQQKPTALFPIGVITAFGLALVIVLGRTLQPGISRTTDPAMLGGYLTNAAEELEVRSNVASPTLVALSPPPIIGLSDLWGVQEAMLQSYRQLFATVEAILLIGASLFLPSGRAVETVIAAALGLGLTFIWIDVCRARALAVVFVHWLMRRAAAGHSIGQPYSALREFQESRTHGAIRLLADADFARLRGTLTGRRMDLHVPLLFIVAWVIIGAVAVYIAAT